MARGLLVVPLEHPSARQYQRTRALLEQQGFQVQVAGERRRPIAAQGLSLTPEVTLDQARGGDYDLVVFVAGRGNRDLLDSAAAHRLAREAVAAGRVVGASGLAVGILAKAGLLRGREATAPISVATLLKEHGARYTAGPVAVADGVVTLRRSEAFTAFGRRLLEEVRRARAAGAAPVEEPT